MTGVVPTQDTQVTTSPRVAHLLVFSLPLLVLIALVALKLISLTLINQWGIGAYETGNFKRSADHLQVLGYGNYIEPYIADFNRGTALLQAGDTTAAAISLEKALTAAPRAAECLVRVNLVYDYQTAGDKALAARQLVQARDNYDQAITVIESRDCGLRVPNPIVSQATREADAKLQKVLPYIQAKQAEARNSRTGTDAGDQLTTPKPPDVDQAAADQAARDELARLRAASTTTTGGTAKRW